MNKEDFVPFETAKKLKEAKFNWKCDKCRIEKIPGTEREGYDEEAQMPATVWDIERTPIPTLWQAQKWLREEKKLYILVDFDLSGAWFYEVFEIVGLCVGEGNMNYPTYEAALSAGIDAALELITNKTE